MLHVLVFVVVQKLGLLAAMVAIRTPVSNLDCSFVAHATHTVGRDVTRHTKNVLLRALCIFV